MITSDINYNNGSCNPQQIINITYPISDASKLSLYGINANIDPNWKNLESNKNQEIDKNCILYAYSIDSICWSCYMSYDDLLKNTVDLNGDFYVKTKLSEPISDVKYDDESTPYTAQLSSEFNFSDCSTTTNANTFSPYSNMESAVNLQTNLTETVSCLFGIPIYYFKLKPDLGSTDYTFKEYALMGVESVKQIKLLITDGQMPSSKPEFSDFGLDFQTDWETEISKQMFATAFGVTAQPMEGDLIYIPMMKRMWMVSGAYEEKNGSLMWNATTFKIMLVKYQEKGSVDLQDTEELVNSLVKNKYEDLFGEDNFSTLDSGVDVISAPEQATAKLYPVYKSDAMRKYITCDTVSINEASIYYKGTLIGDSKYTFLRNDLQSKIIYQKKYCGCDVSISFIIRPMITSSFKSEIIKVGNVKVMIEQEVDSSYIYLNIAKSSRLELVNGSTYFVVIRWSKNMNLLDMSNYLYTHNINIPQYKLTNAHYYIDIDNPINQYSLQYNDMCIDTEGHDVYLSNFVGEITNFKLFDIYNDNISELLQMYPTNQHLWINDTARRINGQQGVQLF